MDQKQYILLYEKFLSGMATPEEIDLLEQHSENFLSDYEWEKEMGDCEQIESKIRSKVNQSVYPRRISKLYVSKWLVAASLLICIASVALFKIKFSQQPVANKEMSFQKNDIAPGGSKAVLTLANGEKILLGSGAKGIISVQGNSRILNVNQGELAYNQVASKDVRMLYNTMSTPRGGSYSVLLADGTKVFLNAESSITFPTAFNGPSRSVTIVGEAYFEVAKNPAMPFIVKANGAETTVLGTHFNVSAYPDEEINKVTLFEGSVKFSKNKNAVLLKPGQEAVTSNSASDIQVKDANLEEALAWKKGYFLFQDEDIHSIMRKVVRWYDVEVVYDPTVKNISFGGSVSRYKNISDLLRLLQSTGTVHFKLEERRITVMR